MNPSDIRICLDVQAPHGAVELDAKQGDSQRRIFITLTDGGVPYRITEDCRPLFTAKKPDGTVLYNLCQVENNTVVYSLTRQTTACPGRVRCEVRLYSSLTLDEAGKPTADSGELLTTAAFTLLVHPQVCSDGDILASATESTQLQKLVNDTQTLITQVQTKLETGEFVGEKGDKGDIGPKGEKGDRGEKGDPGQVNIDDTATGKSSTWSSEKIAKFVEETSAVIEVSYDEASDSVWVTKSHAEIAALVDQGARLQVQLFFMEAAGEEILAVNGMWMKRDLYGDAFVFSFSGYGDVVVPSDDAAFWLSSPGNVRYDSPQGLTVQQQEQARKNIGAISDGELDNALSVRELSLIDKLCPAFTESGSVVTCQPVEGYPLQVVSGIVPKQSGSGDPSPENVRPIERHTAVKLIQCGKNLIPQTEPRTETKSGTTFVLNKDGSINISGTPSSTASLYLARELYVEHLRGKQITINHNVDESVYLAINLFYNDGTGTSYNWLRGNRTELLSKVVPDNALKMEVFVAVLTSFDGESITFYPQLELGATPTPYEQPSSEGFTIELGQTVYGGTLDWATGTLTVDKAYIQLTSDCNMALYEYAGRSGVVIKDVLAERMTHAKGICSHSPVEGSDNSFNMWIGVDSFHIYWVGVLTALGLPTVDDFKAWLDTQNVQVCYELATPTAIQLTPQEILALSGVNTLYSDTGDTTVTGKANPAAEIEKMKNAILALGANV